MINKIVCVSSSLIFMKWYNIQSYNTAPGEGLFHWEAAIALGTKFLQG